MEEGTDGSAAHWKATKGDLAPEFWVLVVCLEEMHQRWHGHSPRHPVSDSAMSLFKQLALRLRALHERCMREPDLVIDVSGQTENTAWEETAGVSSAERRKSPDHVFQSPRHVQATSRPFVLSPMGWPGYTAARDASGLGMQPDELSAISQALMDQQYMDMDRVISFEDVMHDPHRDHVSGADAVAGVWDGAQQTALSVDATARDPACWQPR